MITIIDYGLGNLGSMFNMLKKVGSEALISDDHEVIAQADKLILPGVGSFDAGMERLESRGLIPVLKRRVLDEKIPILGICLGMQLLSNRSEEGQLPGLGWLDAVTIRFKFQEANANLKIPHMGWNQIAVRQAHPLFADLEFVNRFYFVHSYHAVCNDSEDVLATANHGYDFCAAFGHGNIFGVQFHPEKSHRFGMALIKNFVELR